MCRFQLFFLFLAIFTSYVNATTTTSGCTTPPCRKILCLHGGGNTGPEFESDSGMVDLIHAMGPTYEFVFLTAPYGRRTERRALWIRDPPGGKSSPTTDPDWDAQSIAAIDAVVASDGPFYGILGYSQGTAMTISYLAHLNDTSIFQVGMAFCAYVPTTHHGLVSRIDAAAPFSIPMFIYMSTRDWIIDNCQTNNFATKFTSPTRATSSEGGHKVPASGEQMFSTAVNFLNADHATYTPPAPTPTELQLSDCPNIFIVLMRTPMFMWIFIMAVFCFCCCCSCCGYLCYRSCRRTDSQYGESVELQSPTSNIPTAQAV